MQQLRQTIRAGSVSVALPGLRTQGILLRRGATMPGVTTMPEPQRHWSCPSCTCHKDAHIVTRGREARDEAFRALEARAAEIRREAESNEEARRQALEALAQSIRQRTEGDQ